GGRRLRRRRPRADRARRRDRPDVPQGRRRRPDRQARAAQHAARPPRASGHRRPPVGPRRGRLERHRAAGRRGLPDPAAHGAARRDVGSGMMSPLRRAARRLQVTTQVLLHGPGALVGTPAGGATTGRAAPSEAEQRRERVRAGHDESRALTGRPQLLADLDVALPATARERFPRALATDLEVWRALPEEGADEGRRAGLLRELDAWTADDPALSHANGHYRARLLAPGATREDVLAAVLAGTPVVAPPSVAATLPSDVADLVTVVEDLVALRDEVQPLLLQDELFDRESLRLRRTAVR